MFTPLYFSPNFIYCYMIWKLYTLKILINFILSKYLAIHGKFLITFNAKCFRLISLYYVIWKFHQMIISNQSNRGTWSRLTLVPTSKMVFILGEERYIEQLPHCEHFTQQHIIFASGSNVRTCLEFEAIHVHRFF